MPGDYLHMLHENELSHIKSYARICYGPNLFSVILTVSERAH